MIDKSMRSILPRNPNEKYSLTLYIFTIIFFGLSVVFDPFSYSIGNMMIGRGRFADFLDIYTQSINYPNVGSYCVTPYHLIIYRIVSHTGLGINVFFTAFIFAIFYLYSKCVVVTMKLLNVRLFYAACLVGIFPFYFGLWRGNTETLAYLFLFMSVLCSSSVENGFRCYLYSIFVKPSYIIYSPIFISSIRPRTIFNGLVFASLVFALVLSYESIQQSISSSKECFGRYVEDYIVGEGGTMLNNSLFGLIKFSLYSIFDFERANALSTEYYNKIARYWQLPYLALTIFASIIWRKDKLTIVSLALILFNLLYPISADYRLMVLSIPMILMLISGYEKWKLELFLLLLIVIPKHLIWFRLTELNINFTLTSVLTPLLMLGLFIRIIWRKIYEKNF